MSFLLDNAPTKKDWEAFEHIFNLSREDVVQVKNIFRHPCKLYVLKTDAVNWDWEQNINDDKINVYFYHLGLDAKNNKFWSKC